MGLEWASEPMSHGKPARVRTREGTRYVRGQWEALQRGIGDTVKDFSWAIGLSWLKDIVDLDAHLVRAVGRARDLELPVVDQPLRAHSA